MKKLTRIILALIFFLTFTTAGVITLQTNCSFSNSTLYFTIKNIGNDTAYGVSITPFFEGKEYPSKGKQSLMPYDSLSFELPLQIVENGTYLSTLSIEYSDSSGVPAFTLAHCLFSKGVPSQSFILLSFPKITKLGSTKYEVDINVTNVGKVPINSTLFLLLPTSFLSNTSNFSFSLFPGETKRFSTEIQYKGVVQGIFEGIAFVSFSLNNKHFTYFVAFPLSTYQQDLLSELFTQAWIYLILGVIGIIAVLLVFLILKRKRAK